MILLLENRRDRIGGIKDSGIEFEKYKNIEVVLSDKNCNTILDNFLENLHQLDKYHTIIIHESIYHEEKREILFKALEQYIKNNNKILVKFSGHYSNSSFSNNILKVTPIKLYQNLETFLKEYNPNILILAYGENWDLNPLLNALEELNVFIENFDEDEEIDFDEFEDDFDLLALKKILKEEEYQSLYKNLDFGDEVSIEEMKTLACNIKTLIKEKANE